MVVAGVAFIGCGFVIQPAEATTHAALPRPGALAVARQAHGGGSAFGRVAPAPFRRRPPAPQWR